MRRFSRSPTPDRASALRYFPTCSIRSSVFPAPARGPALAVVRDLVALHGGRVSAHSAGIGMGSQFVIRLPLASGMPPAARTLETPAAPVPRRVLLVEDSVDFREALAMLLESHGHEVEAVPDGQTGVERALLSQPDIALID